MSRNRPAEDASMALGRALTAVFEPIIRQAVQEAVTSALRQPGATQTTKEPLGVSADEAAEFAGISRGTFYKEIYPFIMAGQIQSYKVGRRRVIVLESLRAWLNNKSLDEEANR